VVFGFFGLAQKAGVGFNGNRFSLLFEQCDEAWAQGIFMCVTQVL
jgi:hypothetical protein